MHQRTSRRHAAGGRALVDPEPIGNPRLTKVGEAVLVGGTAGVVVGLLMGALLWARGGDLVAGLLVVDFLGLVGAAAGAVFSVTGVAAGALGAPARERASRGRRRVAGG